MSLQQTYPASKRSDIFDQMHESTNWYTINQDGWHLPATKDARDDCGKWFTKGCLNVSAHHNTEFSGKVFIKSFQKHCYRADCEICYKKWMARESNKATRRIEKYEKQSGKPAKHIIVSPPSWKHYTTIKELRKEAYKILKEIGAIGGSVIFHPFRYDKNIKRWYYSPHFHVIGFGWLDGIAETYQKSGWVVKNKGVRDSTFATFYYQLSHAGVRRGNHTVTWFGDLSYSKLKVEPEPNLNECPLCRAKLRLVFHYGLFGWTPPPEVEGEFYVEPEGWRIVEIQPWHKNPVSNCLAIYRKHKPRHDMI